MTDQDSKPPSDRPPGAPKQSGRVAYDSKGNPIWEWETSTGKFDRNVSTQRLKKLEAKLSLEETQPVPSKVKAQSQAPKEPERLPGGGINPYNSSGAKDHPDELASKHPAMAHKYKGQPAAQQGDGRTVVSNSLASKYASAAKRAEAAKPKSFWEKLKARLSGGK